MQCPECGAEAGAGNFCPECGADLRETAAEPACSACGAKVLDGAKFCTECGEPTGVAAQAPAEQEAPPAAAAAAGSSSAPVRRTGTRGKSAGSGQQRQQRRQQSRGQTARSGPARQPGRVSPAVAWGVLGAVVVVAIVVVVLFVQGAGNDSGTTAATTPAGSVQAVAADTSGSYDQLVERANGLYDKGASLYQGKQYEQGARYYLAASKVYAAALQQKATDPAVGTDYATAMFYAGNVDGAIAQAQAVLAKSPEFQMAWFNLGNYLAERGRQNRGNGNAKAADRDYAAAREAYQKAIDIDPASSSGQQAKQQLADLPQ